jgi:hypothetical protein
LVTELAMSDTLTALLRGLDASGAGERESDGQRTDREGTVLVVSCSMAGQQETPAWVTETARPTAHAGTLAGQTRECRDGGYAVHAGIAGCASEHDLDAVLVVGHADCTVLADAHETCADPDTARPPGIETRLAPLVSLVETAIDAGVVDESGLSPDSRRRLAEYSVARHAAFLTEHLAVPVAGAVRDQHGQDLVTVDGTDETLCSRLPDDLTPVQSVRY